MTPTFNIGSYYSACIAPDYVLIKKGMRGPFLDLAKTILTDFHVCTLNTLVFETTP